MSIITCISTSNKINCNTVHTRESMGQPERALASTANSGVQTAVSGTFNSVVNNNYIIVHQHIVL